MATYPGGKNGAGVYQAIINLMPPHRVYVEGFLGSGAVLRNKRPAAINLGIDVDGEVIRSGPGFEGIPNLTVLQADVLSWLRVDPLARDGETLVYLDPPYLMSSRSSPRQIYRCELEDWQHRELLATIRGLGCMVMVSGYRSALYDAELAAWRREEYHSMTRGGRVATECVWCNFPAPFELHDYRYLGQGFRERERIKRKVARWKRRLAAQPALERAALLQAIEEMKNGDWRMMIGGNGEGTR